MKKQRVSFVEGILSVEYPTIAKVFKANVSKYPEAIREAAMIHGFKQKFGDAASGGTPGEKFAEVQSIHDSLLAGEWERTATIDLTPLILEAVARIKGVSVAKMQKAAEKAGVDKVKEWGQHPQTKAEIAKIRAEKAEKAAAEAEDLEIEM